MPDSTPVYGFPVPSGSDLPDGPAQIEALATALESKIAGGIGTAELTALAITTAKIADLAVTTAKLADDAVTAAKIAADAVGSSEIAADAVGSSEIAANAVGSSELADNAVDTAAIAAGAVTRAKLDADLIQTRRVALASAASVAITWASPFPDTNYTVTLGFESASSDVPAFRIASKTASSITVTLNEAASGTVHAVAIHD